MSREGPGDPASRHRRGANSALGTGAAGGHARVCGGRRTSRRSPGGRGDPGLHRARRGCRRHAVPRPGRATGRRGPRQLSPLHPRTGRQAGRAAALAADRDLARRAEDRLRERLGRGSASLHQGHGWRHGRAGSWRGERDRPILLTGRSQPRLPRPDDPRVEADRARRGGTHRAGRVPASSPARSGGRTDTSTTHRSRRAATGRAAPSSDCRPQGERPSRSRPRPARMERSISGRTCSRAETRSSAPCPRAWTSARRRSGRSI